MEELENAITGSHFLDRAPFRWIGLVIRFGVKDETTPQYYKINHKHGDLPVAIELDAGRLQGKSLAELTSEFKNAALRVLVDVGDRYGLPNAALIDIVGPAVDMANARVVP